MRKSLSLSSMIVLLAAFFLIGGCSNNYSPMNSDICLNNESTELEFISLSNNKSALGKEILETVSSYVTYEKGGELKIEYKIDDSDDNKIKVKTTFKVEKEAISIDSWLSLTLDESITSGSVDVEFAPHGVTFSRPAILKIEVKGADLSSIDPDRLGIYYVSNGAWEKMVVKEIIVDKKKGCLKIIDAQIPHFSRYALAHSVNGL